MTDFFKGMFSITSKQAGREVMLAIIAGVVAWKIKDYLDKKQA